MLLRRTMLSSWSALMSKSLQVASSDPVANAFPLGKNCEREGCQNMEHSCRKRNNIADFLLRSALRRVLKRWTNIVANFHQECWKTNSLWQHWCQTRDQWKSACRSHPAHPRAEGNNNNLSSEGWFHLCWGIARTRDKCSVVRAQTERRCFKKTCLECAGKYTKKVFQLLSSPERHYVSCVACINSYLLTWRKKINGQNIRQEYNIQVVTKKPEKIQF